jgi:putative transposase
MDIDFSKSLARLGAAGSATQARIRIIEVIGAMPRDVAGSHADVQRLCRRAGLPRATYYRLLAGRDDEDDECALRDLIQRICLKHRFYGYRRVRAALRRQGMVVNGKKIQQLIREDNLLAPRKAPFLKPPTEKPTAFIVPNLVRALVPSAPDQIWVADITYVHLARAFVYLAVILDAFLRKAVGWPFENTLDASLAITRWRKPSTPESRNPAAPIHHSDRGGQGASIAYRQRLADRDIIISRPGNPFDNAKADSFMKTLKAEEINGKGFADLSDTRRRINGFIAEVYNKDRLHSALGYQSPLEFEPRSRKTKHDTHRGNRTVTEIICVSFQGCSPVLFSAPRYRIRRARLVAAEAARDMQILPIEMRRQSELPSLAYSIRRVHARQTNGYPGRHH